MGTQVSRRTMTKGAAWAVPVVGMAATAPAVAVSAQPVLNANNSVTYNQLPTGATTGDDKYRVYSAPDSNVNPPNSVSSCGSEVTGANGSTKVTNVSMTFWFPADDLTFRNNPSGAATSGWSLLSRSTGTQNAQDANGDTLYAYSTQYTGPTTVSQGKICLGIQNWISTDDGDFGEPNYYNAILVATINGKSHSDAGTNIPISDN